MNFTRWNSPQYWEAIYSGGYKPYPPGDFSKRITFYRTLSEPILIVGCALGHYVKALRDEGVEAWGVESSSYLWDEVGVICPDLIARSDIRDVEGTEREFRRLGCDLDFNTVVTEDMINGYWGDDLDDVLDGCDAFGSDTVRFKVTHLVSTRGRDSSMFWKPLAEWESVRPSHRWVEASRPLRGLNVEDVK